MWWAGLPGLESPATSGRVFADRAVAMACAGRVHPVNPGERGEGTRVDRLSQDFRDWLAEAEDGGDAHARRLALCMACEHAGSETSRADIIRTARWLHRFLTSK